MTIPASAPPTKLPYARVDVLLVEGEIVIDSEGRERRVWPTQREVAQRFGVAPSLVGAFASQRNCTARRKAFEAAVASAPPESPRPAEEPSAASAISVETHAGRRGRDVCG
jgi:hypothetical protein